MSRLNAERAGVGLLLVAALLLAWVRVARADVVPDVEPGYRELTQSFVVDGSALPPDKVLLFTHGTKAGGTEPGWRPEPFQSPYRLGRTRTRTVHLVAVPRSVALQHPTLGELERMGILPFVLDAPPVDDVRESDPRWAVERRARLHPNGSPEVLEDAYLDRAGAVICRGAPSSRLDVDEGRDPCDPDARWKRAHLFAYSHRLELGVGAGAVTLLGVGLFVHRRRKRQRA